MSKEKKMKKGFKVLLITLLVIVLLFASIGIAVAIIDAPARAELRDIEISEIDFKNLKDGVYQGEYHGTRNNFRDVTVEVTVKSGVVTNITVIKEVSEEDQGNKDTLETTSIIKLFGKVIESRSLQVDAISGATLTTNAYLKAIEDALLKAQKK